MTPSPIRSAPAGLYRSSAGSCCRPQAAWLAAVLFVAVAVSGQSAAARRAEISGELKTWHKVTLTLEGPSARESDTAPNPFLDYRLAVTFRPEAGGASATVPGYFAADGNAGNTSAEAGNTWRAHFSPDRPGIWTYRVSFRSGPGVALAGDSAGQPVAGLDGRTGDFTVAGSDKTGADFRAQGRLQYVGEHYLRFAGTGEYFLKGGADSPENLLAYDEFDGTHDSDADSGSYKEVGTFIHQYQPHVRDWRPGDPTWKGGRGKGLIGALNYLAGKGMNSVYFLTYNIDGGDGRDTWMWTSPKERERFDCSKLDQWEIVFEQMDRLGLMLHVVTQETENDRVLGGSAGLNRVRQLYYRELIARFAHHPALVWNLGEENRTPDADRKAIAAYFQGLDAYDHPITVHTQANAAMVFYDALLGDPGFSATSIQSDMGSYNGEAIALRLRSARSGRKWVIFGDEQNPAHTGVVPDADDPTHDLPRKQALWGNLMGGGAGVEWYFGSRYAHMDINCEDWRSRDALWDQTRHALGFFHRHLPFWQMQPRNGLAFTYGALVFARVGQVYAVYLPTGGSAVLQLPEGTYSVNWFNPRSGGELQAGSVATVKGPGTPTLGEPPSDRTQDWAVLVKREPAAAAAR